MPTMQRKPFILRPTLRGMAAASLLALSAGAQAQTAAAGAKPSK
jgi:hypothetical protein